MDDLRTRIAAVVADALEAEAAILSEYCNRYVVVDDDGDEQGDELLRVDCSVNPRHVADVLIRELGLTRFDAPPEYWYSTTIWTTDV